MWICHDLQWGWYNRSGFTQTYDKKCGKACGKTYCHIKLPHILLVIFFVICHTLLPQKKIVGISLQNVRRNPNETFNEIPMKHFLWQNMLPHMANEIPTKLRRNLNDTFLSPHWLYPIYCKRRIIMLEPHTNQ